MSRCWLQTPSSQFKRRASAFSNPLAADQAPLWLPSWCLSRRRNKNDMELYAPSLCTQCSNQCAQKSWHRLSLPRFRGCRSAQDSSTYKHWWIYNVSPYCSFVNLPMSWGPCVVNICDLVKATLTQIIKSFLDFGPSSEFLRAPAPLGNSEIPPPREKHLHPVHRPQLRSSNTFVGGFRIVPKSLTRMWRKIPGCIKVVRRGSKLHMSKGVQLLYTFRCTNVRAEKSREGKRREEKSRV